MSNKTTVDNSIQESLNRKAKRRNLVKTLLPYCGLVFIVIFFCITCGTKFMDAQNVENLINQCFTSVIVISGACFIYATGAMDMSVGAIVGMCCFAGAVTLRSGMPWFVALAVSMVVGVVLELITSLIFQYLKVPVFIVTMCMMYALQGVLITLVQQEYTIDFRATSWLNDASVRSVVLIIVLAVTYYLFHHTKLGPKLKAIGANRETAVQGGINVVLVTCIGFVILGACCGIGGFFTLTRMGYTTASAGAGIMLNVMIGMVLGGNPLTGGSNFRLVNAVVGALTVTILTNGLTLMGLVPALLETFKGCLYLLIVLMTYDKSKGVLVS